MEAITLQELERLPPTKKIPKLIEIHERVTKLIEEKKKRIAELQRPIRKEEVAPAREWTKPKIDEVEEAKPETRPLEEIAIQAPKPPTPQETASYIQYLVAKPAEALAYKAAQIYQEIKDTGIVTPDQQNRIYALDKAVHEQQYKSGEKGTAQMGQAERILDFLKREFEKPYQRN